MSAAVARPTAPIPATPPGSASLRHYLSSLLAALFLIAAVCAAYSRSMSGPFTLDDLPAIPDNPTIQHGLPASFFPPPNGATVTNRPLLNITLALNFSFGQLNVLGYHRFNLALHILAGLTLFGLVRLSLLRPVLRDRFGAVALPLALVIALLWTLHPLQTESVTYIIQRAEALVGFFYLLTLYAFARSSASPHPLPWQIVSVVACLLGMASKEVMVSAPLLVLLYDRTFVSGNFKAALRARWPFYTALAFTWLLLAALVVPNFSRGQSAGFSFDFSSPAQILEVLKQSSNYALTQFPAITRYIWLTVWPYPLTLDYGRDFISNPFQIIPSALLIVSLVAATLWALWRRPVCGFLGAWFFAILAPSSSVVPIITQTIAEHRFYLPLAALLAPAAAGLYWVLRRRSWPVLFALVLAFGWLTDLRNHDYQSTRVLWGDTVAKQPKNARTFANFGIALGALNQFPEAIVHYQRAVNLRPNYPDALNNLGIALAGTGRAPEAEKVYLAAAHFAPKLASVHYNLGNLYIQLQRPLEARREYEETIRLDPKHALAHNNLANVLKDLGFVPESIAAYQAALQIAAVFPTAHNNLANTLLQSGRTAEAIQHYQAALDQNPNLPDAYFGLANAYVVDGRPDAAVPSFVKLLKLAPNFAEGYNNFGTCLLRLGRANEAIAMYQQALRLRPDFPGVRENLEAARALAAQTPGR